MVGEERLSEGSLLRGDSIGRRKKYLDKGLKEEIELDREYQRRIIERERKFLEDLKTEDKVFDRRTLLQCTVSSVENT